MLLKDKIAVVTGSGIGKAIALRYAREGAHVVGAEIDEASGQQTAAEVSAHDRRGLFVKTDMSSLARHQGDGRQSRGDLRADRHSGQ